MELTWLLATSVLLLGVGYAFIQRVPRPGFVHWTLLGAALFALATRDLFRSYDRGRPASGPASESVDRTGDDRSRATRGGRRTPLFARLRSRVAGWFE